MQEGFLRWVLARSFGLHGLLKEDREQREHQAQPTAIEYVAQIWHLPFDTDRGMGVQCIKGGGIYGTCF